MIENPHADWQIAGPGVEKDIKAEEKSVSAEPLQPKISDFEAVLAEPETAAVRLVPLPKRRPRLARKASKVKSGKEKTWDQTGGFWEETGSR